MLSASDLAGIRGLLFIVILSFLAESSHGVQCRNHDGISFDVGSTECVLLSIPRYNEKQWATCLTASYVRRLGYNCAISTASACWFQCQLELFGGGSGEVYEDCRCSSSSVPPTLNEDMPTLSPECFSPGGIDCNWYRDCLEERYPCQGTEDDYAIMYAERYCNLFIDSYNDFSASGQMWVDGVRKCLQVALVPLLRPWLSKTCAEISQRAFDSHPDCYLNPGSGAPSICDLPCTDAWTAFYVVNIVGDAFTSAPLETGLQMLRVIKGCFGTTGCTGIATTTLILTIPGYGAYRARSAIATKIGLLIANLLMLEDKEIGWFPYYDDDEHAERLRRDVVTTSQPNDDTMLILLVDLQTLGMTAGVPVTNGQNKLEETITEFADAVNDGQLSQISVALNGSDVVFEVMNLGKCRDTFCVNDTDVTILATAPSEALKISLSPINIMIFTALHIIVWLVCLI